MRGTHDFINGIGGERDIYFSSVIFHGITYGTTTTTTTGFLKNIINVGLNLMNPTAELQRC